MTTTDAALRLVDVVLMSDAAARSQGRDATAADFESALIHTYVDGGWGAAKAVEVAVVAATSPSAVVAATATAELMTAAFAVEIATACVFVHAAVRALSTVTGLSVDAVVRQFLSEVEGAT